MTGTKRLCIVPCGAAKIWDKKPDAGPMKAQYVYTGVFAMACQRYAKTHFNEWVILSAKYGFLFPDDVINESYNVSFNRLSKETIGIDRLKEQVESKNLSQFETIVVLGGKHYVNRTNIVFNNGQEIILPLSDCKGIGYMLQKLTNAIESKKELDTSLPSIIDKVVSNETKTISVVRKNIGKYSPLYDYLRIREDTDLMLTIHEIESIVGFSLPDSAFKHRAWWSNDITHSQAKAWLMAGWEVGKMESHSKVSFSKCEE